MNEHLKNALMFFGLQMATFATKYLAIENNKRLLTSASSFLIIMLGILAVIEIIYLVQDIRKPKRLKTKIRKLLEG